MFLFALRLFILLFPDLLCVSDLPHLTIFTSCPAWLSKPAYLYFLTLSFGRERCYFTSSQLTRHTDPVAHSVARAVALRKWRRGAKLGALCWAGSTLFYHYSKFTRVIPETVASKRPNNTLMFLRNLQKLDKQTIKNVTVLFFVWETKHSNF